MKIDFVYDDTGYLPDKYGKFANKEDIVGHLCRRSFPFEIKEIPEGTRAIYILFFDWDSVPVCGFPWIHWCGLISDIDSSEIAIPEDISRQGMPHFVQGFNSDEDETLPRGTGYRGPCPPNGDHIYTLRVYALDYVPQLEEPFWANDAARAIRGHKIEEAEIFLPSRS